MRLSRPLSNTFRSLRVDVRIDQSTMLSAILKLIPRRVKRSLARVIFAGSRYQCPLCGFAGNSLGPVGIDLPLFRENRIIGAGLRAASCRLCYSWDRERLLYLYLARESGWLERAESVRVLHIAPEPRLSQRLSEAGFRDYVCGVRHEPGYVYPEGTPDLDATNLSFADCSFDLIICNHVLEHITDDRRAMRELFRVLKPGGEAILQVPLALDFESTREDASIATPQARLSAYGQEDHVRLYGRDYASRLRGCGFEVECLGMGHKYPDAGLNPDEQLHVCLRPHAMG